MDSNYNTEQSALNLQQIFGLLLKHWKLVVISSFVCGLAGLLITIFAMTPIYESSAKMIVNTRNDEQKLSISNDQLNTASRLVDTYAIIIKSDTVLNVVIDELSLPETYAELSDKVAVLAVNATQVMRISVQDADPIRAQRILDSILRVSPSIIIDAVEAGSVKTISKPTLPTVPVSPSKRNNTLFAAFAGFAVSVLFIILRYLFDTTFRSEENIREQLDLPVLGVIPSVDSCNNSKKGRYAR